MATRDKTHAPERPARKVPRAVREPQMLDAAVSVFAGHGYHGASMAEIATRAGVTKPMVYAYFGSKDELYLACIEHAGTRLIGALGEAGSEERAPERQLWQRVLAFFAFIGAHRDEWRVLNREASLSGGPFPEQVARSRGRVIRLVAEQLEEAARAQGLAESSAEDFEPLAHALVGAGESLAEWWVDHPDEPPEAVALRLMNLHWMGLRGLIRGEIWSPPGA